MDSKTIKIIQERESNVRSYVRSFPTTFEKSKDSIIWDEHGRRFIDFFAGAGSLNYGHNNQIVNNAVIDYLKQDGILLSLDKSTKAKVDFIQSFVDIILKPRDLDYKLQFTGPTGTNVVEAALKLARKVKKRSGIFAFTNAYHGATIGSLSVTANTAYRNEFYGIQSNVSFLPFDGYFGNDVNTANYIEKILTDKSSGYEIPAAMIVECVQGEGGINIASKKWLRSISEICKKFDILLILDEIQIGNGRSGSFFSFEEAGIVPDMVCMSKSIGGGFPMSLLLLKPEIDQWKPGEHSGTFRGNNLAFVAAKELLSYWKDDQFVNEIAAKSLIVKNRLEMLANNELCSIKAIRGKGLIWGIELELPELASKITKKAFEKGLLIETCGSLKNIIKLMPPLVIENALLEEGLNLLFESFNEVIAENTQHLQVKLV